MKYIYNNKYKMEFIIFNKYNYYNLKKQQISYP